MAMPIVEAAAVPTFPASQNAIVLFTSGSTGLPQPHMKTWGTLVCSAMAAGKRLIVPGLEGATLLGTVPHQHSYGIESTVLLGLQYGLPLWSERPLLPGDVYDALNVASQTRILVTTPIHLRALLTAYETLPNVDLILSATAPLSPQLAMEGEAKFKRVSL